MTKIQYTGPSDFRELDAADLKKADVSGFRKTSFPRDVPVDVSDDAAREIVENKELFGNFELTPSVPDVEFPPPPVEGPGGSNLGNPDELEAAEQDDDDKTPAP